MLSAVGEPAAVLIQNKLMMHKLAIAVLFTCLAFGSTANDCEQLYQQHLQTDMSLDYQAFDQTPGQGFRALAEISCQKQAADLIESYIRTTGAEQSSLRWHIAQLRASHGDYESAIDYANQVLLKKEDFSVRALRWNDYVLATVGFLERDKEKLLYHRDRVATASDEHQGNVMNLKLLDSLIKYFDYNYNYATSRIE